MKLITLNIWGGHVHKPLMQFIAEHKDVDIFCFQEVYHNSHRKIADEDRKVNLNIFAEMHALLPKHDAYFRPAVENIFGIGMLVNKNIDVLGEGDISIHENLHYKGTGPTHSRNLQWLECHINKKTYSIFNVHGLWNGMGKTDSPERIAQSKRIKEFMDSINTPKILCGDFNLRPDTKSLQIIEHGMHNLIKLHNINSTRTNWYPKEEKFADYIFTSPEVKVHSFKVMPDEVSDHAPLLLEFE